LLLIFHICAGSLILEMGALSKMTGDPIYESVALRALRKLWSMQSSLKLFGTTLDVVTGQWIEYSSGIGAGRLTLTLNQNWDILYSSVRWVMQHIIYMFIVFWKYLIILVILNFQILMTGLDVSFVGFYLPGLF